MEPEPPPHRRREAYGPRTWALIREAYLGGTCAPHLSRIYGPHTDTIRKRAWREGWTRSAHAAAVERHLPLPPGSFEAGPPEAAAADPVRAAIDRAAGQLAQGRGAEAAATLKAAEALRRLQADLGSPTGPASPPTRPRLTPEQEVAATQQLLDAVEARADELARGVLQARFPGVPAVHSAFVLHWRALHLGPEAARSDREHAMHAGWGSRVYTPEGELKPLAVLLAEERRGLLKSFRGVDDERSLEETPDPLPPDPDASPPAWTAPITPGAGSPLRPDDAAPRR